MADSLIYFTEGPRILLSSVKNRFFPRKYDGTAKEICEQVVRDCWNGRYFQASTSNFAQFWTRDFGWCTKSLLQLGYKKEVHQTLRYALNRFQKAGRVTTTITPKGKPFDTPVPAADSLPYLIHSLKISKFPPASYTAFLNREIKRYFNYFIDEETGLIRPGLHVSSMKDLSVRKSSCYDNCLVGLLARDLKGMKLANPFERFNYPELIRRHFWNGKYFYDDLSRKEYVAGDANLFPFLFGLVSDKEMLQSSVAAVQEAGLDSPFPLKYTASRAGVDFVWEEFLMRDYESNALWMHMGLLFARMMQGVDKGKVEEYQKKYAELIEKHRGFPEVLMADGRPYSNLFYYCDRGMLWAANYLTL